MRGWKTLCFEIGYSEPRRAESRQGTSTLAKSSRVLDSDWLGDEILEVDWLAT